MKLRSPAIRMKRRLRLRRNAKDRDSGLGKLATSLLAIATAVITSIVTSFASYAFLSQRDIDQSHRLNKIEVYREFGVMARLAHVRIEEARLATDKKGITEDLRKYVWSDFSEFGSKLVLWASPDVIRSWNRFREIVGQEGDLELTDELIYSLDHILVSMRQDLDLQGVEGGVMLKAVASRHVTVAPQRQPQKQSSASDYSDLFANGSLFPVGFGNLRPGMKYADIKDQLPIPSYQGGNTLRSVQNDPQGPFVYIEYTFASLENEPLCKILFYPRDHQSIKEAAELGLRRYEVSAANLRRTIQWNLEDFSSKLWSGGYQITLDSLPCR